jgi:hypothetical protein
MIRLLPLLETLMRATVVRAIALLSLISFACAEKPKTESSPQPALPQSKAGAVQPTNSSATGAAKAQTPEQPTYPKGARYTIYCTAFGGPMHVQEATDAKNKIASATKKDGWYVVHENDQSLLYYGYYKTFEEKDDAKEAKRFHNDLAYIRGLTDRMMTRPFEHAQPVPLNAPDPAAPPEWNLANAKGYWTLQIAAYKDSPERKQAAVDAVRGLRAAGENAYFYHGETVSSVCIGAWPKEAIQAQDSAVAGSGNPNETVMVSSVPLPENLTKNMRDENGQKIKYYEARILIADPTMQAAKKKYPDHAVNGYLMPLKAKDKNGKDTIVYDPSKIMIIPQPEENALNRPSIAAQPQQTMPRPMGQQPGAGSKLRSVGE